MGIEYGAKGVCGREIELEKEERENRKEAP
jgi:hypothetical protein